MMMSVRYLCLLAGVILMWAACGCSENEEPSAPGYLKIETESLSFDENSGSRTVTVDTNRDWSWQSDEAWITGSRNGSVLTVSVSENEQKGVRSGTIEITAGEGLTHRITVQQLGWGKAILVSTERVKLGAAGEKFEIEVTSNVEVKKKISGEWISETPSSRSGSHPQVTEKHGFSVGHNTNDEGRRGSIVFSDSDEGSEVAPVTVEIVQNGLGEYEPADPGNENSDIEVKVTGGEASSWQPGEGIEKSFDGDMNTIYHSNWDNSREDYFPITLTYYFDEEDMDYFIYYPRQTGYNGYFEETEIEVCTVANSRGEEEWMMVMTHDFEGSGQARRIDFESPLIGVKAMRFTVKSGYGDGQGFASCAEMKFFKKNPGNFDWSSLFTDASCSELKEGVTEAAIDECPYSFYKNIAFYMLHGRYEREFRINSFRAYEHPNRQAGTNKTSAYSLLDNPTGINVKGGETLIVLADLKNEGVSLRVQNLDKPGGDGFGGKDYPIATGLNKIAVESDGLVYVMYHTDRYAEAPEVRLHFVTGEVNGYYDSENPTHAGRWQELLGNAKGKYFDVTGKYAHLTFPTESFRRYTKDMDALIGAYDELVSSEQQLLGLERYGRMFRNRMYFHVMYTSYMYSTWYHTAYHEETMSTLCDENQIKTGGVWGPAHEVGHSNQTRGLVWTGMTEVSNNIMSEYVQTSVFGQPSRVQTENMGDPSSPNRYSKAWNSIVVGNKAHALEEDVFCKLIPLWQLELYFGKVLGRTPREQSDKGGFYPDCYEYLRTHRDIDDNGACQLEFAYIASLCAEADLSDFFEKWGFFTPVDVTIDDYGEGRVKVTAEMVANVKQRIENLGYSKPDVPLEYITDNNYGTFRSRLHVTKGSASRNGNRLTMTDWKNVVTYEVREGSETGRLIHVSDGMLGKSDVATFTVPDWEESYRVYAVEFDNKRIEVTFD